MRSFYDLLKAEAAGAALSASEAERLRHYEQHLGNISLRLARFAIDTRGFEDFRDRVLAGFEDKTHAELRDLVELVLIALELHDANFARLSGAYDRERRGWGAGGAHSGDTRRQTRAVLLALFDKLKAEDPDVSDDDVARRVLAKTGSTEPTAQDAKKLRRRLNEERRLQRQQRPRARR